MSKSITLYELTDAYKAIFESVMDDEADLDVLENTLHCVEASIEVKADNIVRFVKALESDAAACDSEIKRLTDRKRARLNKVERIKKYLLTQLQVAGIEKIQGSLFTVRLQKNPQALSIDDEKAIPTQYLIIVPAREEINKEAVKAALKLGVAVPGAKLTQGISLRIA